MRNPCAGCATAFKKYIVEKLLPFPDLKKPFYIHDWYILMISVFYGKVGFINEPLSKYRQHQDNNVGMNKKFNKGLDFYLNARSVNINYRYNFCSELLKKINSPELIKFQNYLNKIKATKFINFNIKQYNYYTKILDKKPKNKYLHVFHMPLFVLALKKEK